MREREEVLREFGSSQCIIGDDCKHAHCRVEHAMADEIVRLREALAAATRVLDLVTLRCENFHHSKRDRHKSNEPCPVVERIERLRNGEAA
jgi:hypothetical protein